MKVLTVFGTRPEAIKLAPVVRELELRSPSANIQSVVCVTAQHRQMLDQVLELFNIRPNYDLDLMSDNQTLTQVAALILSKLEPILKNEKPDWILVQGDTTTVAAASLAAFYARLRVGHVEAGLRTHNKWEPYPEEINRRVASVIADVHFAPTPSARQNLLRENIPTANIIVTGNPVIDALHWVASLPIAYDQINTRSFNLKSWGERPNARRLILVTAHRRENFGEPLENICWALRDLAEQYGDQIQIVYPVHLNPNVQKPVYQLLDHIPNICLTPPLDYLPLVQLMKQAYLVVTDSGGIQEEAPGLGIPVLVLRDVTERPEAVDAGTVRLVGTSRAKIVQQVRLLMDDQAEFRRMAQAINPYGDGHAAERIVDALINLSIN